MIDSIIVLWLVLSPCVYASFAGRASMNLIETDHWHKWAFRFFLVGTLGLISIWLMEKPPIICSEFNNKWQTDWLEHVKQYHRGVGADVEAK